MLQYPQLFRRFHAGGRPDLELHSERSDQNGLFYARVTHNERVLAGLSSTLNKNLNLNTKTYSIGFEGAAIVVVSSLTPSIVFAGSEQSVSRLYYDVVFDVVIDVEESH